MNPNLKIILVIFATFLMAFATSLLLEIALFQNWVRYSLVILLILFELYLGFVVYQSIYKK